MCIPVNWLEDSGVLGKMKLVFVQLTRKYIKRVASETNALDGLNKEPNIEFLVLQGLCFVFYAHQQSLVLLKQMEDIIKMHIRTKGYCKVTESYTRKPMS
ncbi:hypothetical protein QVD17_41637 [Tagetes erecta]|uniref:Uncharacterized protein n=1 Tax=Tagetes erecta TaxID=13708 RepID=A0AAD8JM79_TARER|nr:hypothetical protein QVD17_41637 [Tagetes erecta]